jgi:hypothetical protein
MRSVGGHATIVATVITLVVVPIYKNGKVHFQKEKVTIGHIECERGTRIAPSPEAERLGVVGEICRNVITRVVYGEDYGEDSIRYLRTHFLRGLARS